MPQTFHVLLCVICKTFQVQIVKKSSNKWNCKVCDSKQSVQQVYAKGTGAECRDIVQRLNEARGKREEGQSNNALASVAQAEQEACPYFPNESDFVESHNYTANNTFLSASQVPTALHSSQKPEIRSVSVEKSRWSVYLE